VIGGRDKHVHALDAETGAGLWTFPTKARVDASPVIVGTRVFAASLDGNLYLLELASGEEVWTFSAGGAFIASPAVGAGRLVISEDSGLVYAFDITPAPGPAPAGGKPGG
jgi:outer membrane protein assembly factor BamB